MLRRLTLRNFMSHVDSQFEFAPCLTVLTGPNNSGKSAVVEALQCLCGHGRSDYMVRHGEKETTVEVETGEGDVVQWRRIKDTNSFVINGVEHFRGTPEDLHQILKLPRVPAKEGSDDFDVHFGEQKRPIFLVGETGSRAATFFASSSDAQYLMQMQDLHKQRTRDAKSDSVRIRGEVKRLDERLEELVSLDRVEPLLAQADRSYTKLVDRTEEIEVLEAAIEVLRFESCGAIAKKKPVEAIACLSDPPQLKPEEQLREIATNLVTAQAASEICSGRATTLKPLALPPKLQDEAGLSEAVDRLTQTSRRNSRMQRFVAALDRLPQHPEYRDAGSLGEVVQFLHNLGRIHERSRSQQSALSNLAQPGSPRDTRPLREALAHLDEAVKGVTHYKKVLDEAALHVRQAHDQISAWADENEICPTCGAPIDTDRMIARLEAAVA